MREGSSLLSQDQKFFQARDGQEAVSFSRAVWRDTSSSSECGAGGFEFFGVPEVACTPGFEFFGVWCWGVQVFCASGVVCTQGV